jgi:hypothetical protein
MPAAWTKTIAAANLLDVDGFKTSIATAATAQSYSGGALNGASASAGPAHGFAFIPSATLASNAGSYVPGSAVTFVGTYLGVATTRTGLIVGADGNETVLGDGPLDGPLTSIGVAAQVNTGGSFQFGWTDMLPAGRGGPTPGFSAPKQIAPWLGLTPSTSGAVHVGYAGSRDDTIAGIAGTHIEAAIQRIYANTAVAVTIFVGA